MRYSLLYLMKERTNERKRNQIMLFMLTIDVLFSHVSKYNDCIFFPIFFKCGAKHNIYVVQREAF